MRSSRKRDHSEEGRNRGDEDDTETGNAEQHLQFEKHGISKQNSGNIEEAASFTEATRKHDFTDSEKTSYKRIRQDTRFQSPEMPSESKSQAEEDYSRLPTSQQKKTGNLTRRQSRRSSKHVASHSQAEHEAVLSTSKAWIGADCCEKESQRHEVKLSVTRGKSMKIAHRRKLVKEHRSSKTTLVTLRASQEEEEEADDSEPDDEDECFAPEELNKAPAFVPVGLRSPKPVPVQIEETMEELEISVNIPDVQVATDVESLSHVWLQPVTQREEKGHALPTFLVNVLVIFNLCLNNFAGVNDGSTEAAMTLLAMGDPMFQLKGSTEEWVHTSPAQDELNMASSLVTHDYSEQDRAPNQYLVSSVASAEELVPLEDVSNTDGEKQSTGAGTGAEECFEENATDTSDSSLPMVSSVRLRRGRLLNPKPDFGVLKPNENVIQKPLNTNVVMEQVDQIQSVSMDLRSTAEMQKVEEVKPTASDASVLRNFATSVELIKEMDNKERTEKEMRDVCGASGDLPPECEKSHLGLEDFPNQSSVDGPTVQNPCPAEHSLSSVSFAHNETCAQDCQQQCVTRTEETSVVSDDHRCPEEEQTFILTLVEILADSEEFAASALLEQTSEPLLPAPILISPVKSSETGSSEAESIGSSTTADDEFGASPSSSVETKQLQSASVEPVLNVVHTAQKRSAAELAENDSPLAKKTLSTVVESNLESPSKGYSIKSKNTQRIASGNPFQKPEDSTKKKVLTSGLVPEAISPVDEGSQGVTSKNLGEASLENPACSQEEEVTSGLTSSTKPETGEQGKLRDVHEAAQLEHTEHLTESSKTPLLSRSGRKPLGFLSLISKKSNSESAKDIQGKRGKTPKPHIGTLKRTLKRTPSSKDSGESCSLPSTSASSCMENVTAAAEVKVPSNEPSKKSPLHTKDEEKEEEPTRISEYFFSDIFMEVDDSE
ncbi:BDP1 factor, partial [Alectura lathami]|nr:BDP1 factor [Alectura lathami]